MWEFERTTLVNLPTLGAAGMTAIEDGLSQFLVTNPVAICVRNIVSVAIGEGGTVGFCHPGIAAEEMVEDLLSL